jgi:quercetin dioxygenase-like cupin family protein
MKIVPTMFSVVLLSATGAAAQVIEQLLPLAKFEWPQSQANAAGSAMRSGLETIFVVGDGKSERLFSIVFRVPPNTRIPPHSHPDARSCFVLSGTWYFGYGLVRDEAKLQALPAGSSYTEPANMIHFAGTKDAEAIAECTAIGPTGTTFAHAEDDPRNAGK